LGGFLFVYGFHPHKTILIFLNFSGQKMARKSRILILRINLIERKRVKREDVELIKKQIFFFSDWIGTEIG